MVLKTKIKSTYQSKPKVNYKAIGKYNLNQILDRSQLFDNLILTVGVRKLKEGKIPMSNFLTIKAYSLIDLGLKG